MLEIVFTIRESANSSRMSRLICNYSKIYIHVDIPLSVRKEVLAEPLFKELLSVFLHHFSSVFSSFSVSFSLLKLLAMVRRNEKKSSLRANKPPKHQLSMNRSEILEACKIILNIFDLMCKRLYASLQRFRGETVAVRGHILGGCQSLVPIWSTESGVKSIVAALEDSADEFKKLLSIMQNILRIGEAYPLEKRNRRPEDRDPDGASDKVVQV